VLPSLKAKVAVALGIGGGFSKSELGGLRFEDIAPLDTGKALVHIKRAVVDGVVGEVKTENRDDSTYIDSTVNDLLKEYRESEGATKTGYVFGRSPEEPQDLDNFAEAHVKPFLNFCVECGGVVGSHAKSEKEWLENPRKKQHTYQPRSTQLPEWLGWHSFRHSNVDEHGIEVAAAQARNTPEVADKNYDGASKKVKRNRKVRKEIEERKRMEEAKQQGKAKHQRFAIDGHRPTDSHRLITNKTVKEMKQNEFTSLPEHAGTWSRGYARSASSRRRRRWFDP
jgi:hypothetical protein